MKFDFNYTVENPSACFVFHVFTAREKNSNWIEWRKNRKYPLATEQKSARSVRHFCPFGVRARLQHNEHVHGKGAKLLNASVKVFLWQEPSGRFLHQQECSCSKVVIKIDHWQHVTTCFDFHGTIVHHYDVYWYKTLRVDDLRLWQRHHEIAEHENSRIDCLHRSMNFNSWILIQLAMINQLSFEWLTQFYVDCTRNIFPNANEFLNR